MVVTASSIQLATGTPNLRDRVEARLQDSGNSRWSTDDLDEARRALLYDPQTSGGLLLLVPEPQAAAFLREVPAGRAIGKAVPRAPKPLIVRG